MKKKSGFLIALGAGGLAWVFSSGCATPAVVFVSPDYKAQNVTRVTVQGFTDYAGQPGSGAMMADVFEKYLLALNYQIVNPDQGQVDAIVTGTLSELSNTSEQTVMVDIPQEETEPIYQQVTVQGRHGTRTVTEQTGSQTVYSDQVVPQTETLPARVAFNARLVSAKGGQLLWSGSGSADGLTISSAAEAAASKVVQSLQKHFAKT